MASPLSPSNSINIQNDSPESSLASVKTDDAYISPTSTEDNDNQENQQSPRKRKWTPKLRRRSPNNHDSSPSGRNVVFSSSFVSTPKVESRFRFFQRTKKEPSDHHHLSSTTTLRTSNLADIVQQVAQKRESSKNRKHQTPPKPPPPPQRKQSSLEEEEVQDNVEVSIDDEQVQKQFYHPPTALHSVCRTADSITELWNARHLITVQSAATMDASGQTALHLVSHNSALAEALAFHDDTDSIPEVLPASSLDYCQTYSERQLLEFIVNGLVKTYPAAMMTPDHNGYIPFEESLTEWVNQSHAQQKVRATVPLTAAERFPMNSIRNSSRTLTSLASRWSNPTQASTSPNNKTPTRSRDIERGTSSSPWKRLRKHTHRLVPRDRQFPVNIKLTPKAHFGLQVLSAILDYLERRTAQPVKRTSLIQRQQLSPTHKREGAMNGLDVAMDGLRHLTVLDISAEIVQSIASIPDLVKTILLMEDEAQRSFVLSTSVIQRVLANKHSVGTWLTGMLQSDEKRVSNLAIEYLKLVSDLNYGGSDESSLVVHRTKKKAADHQSTITMIRQDQDELHHEVSRLEDFVPSLLSLDAEDIEEIATTRVVRRVLDRLISRPFAVTVVFCDAIFLAILLVGFRLAIKNLLLGALPGKVLRWIYVANTGIFYFIIRELGKAVALCMITRQARIYIWSFWNLTDLLSTVLALISTVAIRSHFGSQESSHQGETSTLFIRNLLAITTGLLWLRVLNFLKGINMQLATFVLAILQITRDILWFCVILLTLVVSFAQMFFTLLAPQECASSEEMVDSRECTQAEYYLKVYAILLGDFGTFERENFTSTFSVILAVFYTFLVVLVLLNVLIAVASDSYEKCLVRSQHLFGRARVMMIAELVSFQKLLRRKVQADLPNQPSAPIYKTWWYSDTANGWSRGSIVFFSLSSLVVLTWIIGETVGYFAGKRYGNVWMSLGSILINVALYVGIMVFLSTGAADIVSKRNINKDGEDESVHMRYCGSCFDGWIRKAMLRLLGSTNAITGAAKDDQWKGRLVFLQNEMDRIAEETKADTNEKVKGLETLIHETESRLQTQVASIDNGLHDLKSTLLERRRSNGNAERSCNEQLPDTVSEQLQGTLQELLDALKKVEKA